MGIQWDPMGSHGVPWDPWDPMGPHGTPWGPMGHAHPDPSGLVVPDPSGLVVPDNLGLVPRRPPAGRFFEKCMTRLKRVCFWRFLGLRQYPAASGESHFSKKIGPSRKGCVLNDVWAFGSTRRPLASHIFPKCMPMGPHGTGDQGPGTSGTQWDHWDRPTAGPGRGRPD